MPRRLIIGVLIVLILGILGGTVVLVIQRLKPATPTAKNTPVLPIDTSAVQQPANIANTNNNVPAPATANNAPISAPLALPLTDQQVSGYFQDNIDLTGGSTNYTDKYQQQYPTEKRTATTLAEFTKAQPIVTKLPTPNLGAIKQLPADSPSALANYLGTAENIITLSDQKNFATVMSDLIYKDDTNGIATLALSVHLFQEDLVAASVPPSALPVHKLLLGYTQLLGSTYDQIAKWDQDKMKAIVAMRQLEEINKQYYSLITQELRRLQTTAPVAGQ